MPRLFKGPAMGALRGVPHRVELILWTSVLGAALASAAPSACRWCKGNCTGSVPKLVDGGANDTDVDEVSLVLSLAELDGNSTSTRHKRESLVERRPCEARFQLELVLIPAAIFVIPLSLLGLLLCVCFCGPKETRGKLPEKMWGVSLSTKKRTRHNTEDELDYGDGYVQRKDSKKTRFNTNVLVIERRRESAVSVASNSPRSTPDPVVEGTKRTRFSREVSVVDGNDTEGIQTTRL